MQILNASYLVLTLKRASNWGAFIHCPSFHSLSILCYQIFLRPGRVSTKTSLHGGLPQVATGSSLVGDCVKQTQRHLKFASSPVKMALKWLRYRLEVCLIADLPVKPKALTRNSSWCFNFFPSILTSSSLVRSLTPLTPLLSMSLPWQFNDFAFLFLC